jgi:hypothetical protein
LRQLRAPSPHTYAVGSQVIMFNSTARSIFMAKPIAEVAPTLEYVGGGTEFGHPLRLSLEHMRGSPAGTSPTLIFMCVRRHGVVLLHAC